MLLKTKRFLIFVSVFFFMIASFCLITYAHPGRTDSNGGHYNRSTGEYHYHHGYPAHQHIDGECPYDYDDKNNASDKTINNNDNFINSDTIFNIVTVTIVLFDIIIYTIYFKKELLDSDNLFLGILEYFKGIFLYYLLFLMFSIPTVIIWVLIEELINIDINSGDSILLSPFYTACIFVIAMSIMKVIKLLIKKIKNVQNKQQKKIKEQNTNDSIVNNQISTQSLASDNMNNIDITDFFNKEKDMLDVGSFFAKLFFSSFNTKYTRNNCFVRELLYFSQLYVINTFKNLKSVELYENDFYVTSRYSVGKSLSIYPRMLICVEQEENNIKSINRNNYFTKYDIELLYKILFVAYKRGYATLNRMLEIFDEIDKSEFIWFKKDCEAYFKNLTNEITFIRDKEIEKIESFEKRNQIFNNDEVRYSFKEIEKLFVI